MKAPISPDAVGDDLQPTPPDAAESARMALLTDGHWLIPRVQIEVSRRCNVRCIMCDWHRRTSTLDPNRTKLDLTADEVRNLFVGMPRIRVATLSSGIGEPFMNPDILEISAFLRSEKGSPPSIITNGTKLTPETNRAILDDAKLATLFVSMHGASKHSAEAIMQGADFEAIVAGLNDFQNQKKNRKTTRPGLVLLMVGMKQNIAELPDMVRLAKKLGAESLRLTPMEERTSLPELSEQAIDEPTDELRQCIENAESLAKELNVNLVVMSRHRLMARQDKPETQTNSKPTIVEKLPIGKQTTKFCMFPFDNIYVSMEGYIGLCCSAEGRDVCMGGSLERGSVAKTWDGQEYRKIRRSLLTGENLPAYCQACRRAPKADPLLLQMHVLLKIYRDHSLADAWDFLEEFPMEYQQYERQVRRLGLTPIDLTCNTETKQPLKQRGVKVISSEQVEPAEACRLCGSATLARTAYKAAFAECTHCRFIFRRAYDRKKQAEGMGLSAGVGGGYREYFLAQMLTNDLGLGTNGLLLFGTGNTNTLETLLEEGVDVVGCDLSLELIEQRRQQFGHDRFCHSHELRADQLFDGLIGVEVFEHFDAPAETLSFLNERLTQDAVICGTTDFIQDGQIEEPAEYFRSGSHVACWSTQSMTYAASLIDRQLAAFQMGNPGIGVPGRKTARLWPNKRVFFLYPPKYQFYFDSLQKHWPTLPIDRP